MVCDGKERVGARPMGLAPVVSIEPGSEKEPGSLPPVCTRLYFLAVAMPLRLSRRDFAAGVNDTPVCTRLYFLAVAMYRRRYSPPNTRKIGIKVLSAPPYFKPTAIPTNKPANK